MDSFDGFDNHPEKTHLRKLKAQKLHDHAHLSWIINLEKRSKRQGLLRFHEDQLINTEREIADIEDRLIDDFDF